MRDLAGVRRSRFGGPIRHPGVLGSGRLPHVIVAGSRKQTKRRIEMCHELGGDARRVKEATSQKIAASPDGESLWNDAEASRDSRFSRSASGAIQSVKLSGIRLVPRPRLARPNEPHCVGDEDDEDIWVIWSVAPDGREQTRLYGDKQADRRHLFVARIERRVCVAKARR